MTGAKANIAIVDYGVGNLYSITLACERVGLSVSIVDTAKAITDAHALLLPGVGAFADAMAGLERLHLVEAVQDFVRSGKPFLGICLGLQLLMDESDEFGRHHGLGLIPGNVMRLAPKAAGAKVPLVGWKPIQPAAQGWDDTLLAGLPAGAHFYFVHSYHVIPTDPQVALCHTHHGDQTFCAAIRRGNVTAFQFHPERSGINGLSVFRNFARNLESGAQ